MIFLFDNGHDIEMPSKRSPDDVLREYACFIRIRQEENFTGISLCFMFRTQIYIQFSRNPNCF